MRWERKKAPPVPAHGEEKCTASELQAWRLSGYAVFTYQFQERNCVTRGNSCLEVPDVAERERLMGFDEGYTLGFMASSAAKSQPAEEF